MSVLAPKIERASMDGSDRQTLHSTRLSQPNGISIDYVAQRIYWTDGDLRKIESSLYDGSLRKEVLSLVSFDRIISPSSISLDLRVTYWADTEQDIIYSSPKESVPFEEYNTIGLIYSQFSGNVTVVAISPTKQNIGDFFLHKIFNLYSGSLLIRMPLIKISQVYPHFIHGYFDVYFITSSVHCFI